MVSCIINWGISFTHFMINPEDGAYIRSISEICFSMTWAILAHGIVSSSFVKWSRLPLFCLTERQRVLKICCLRKIVSVFLWTFALMCEEDGKRWRWWRGHGRRYTENVTLDSWRRKNRIGNWEEDQKRVEEMGMERREERRLRREGAQRKGYEKMKWRTWALNGDEYEIIQ